MKPPFSIIFMTTLFGLGQGLFLALYTGQVYSLFKLLPLQEGADFYGLGSTLVLVLLMAGLVASIFHLGHPERARLAIRQWRTSWLSREVILLPLLLGLVVLYGGLHLLEWTPALFTIGEDITIDVTILIGGLATLGCFALFLATGMIYASIRFLQEWATPLTVLNFILMGGASGFTLASSFATHSAPQLVGFFGGWAILITLAALASRLASLYRNHRIKHKSNLKTAIGIRHQTIRQLHQGAMGGSFNTKEFFHGQGNALLRNVLWSFLTLVFVLPVLLLLIGMLSGSTALLYLAIIIQYSGLLLERWYFFADAKHPQNTYYQQA